MPILPAPSPALGMMVFLLIVVWAPSVWAIVAVARRDARDLLVPVLAAAALILGAVGYGVAATEMELGDVPDALQVLLVFLWPPVSAFLLLVRGLYRSSRSRRLPRRPGRAGQ